MSSAAFRLTGIWVYLVTMTVGCEKQKPSGPPRQPTRGTLTYNGKPVKGAVVTFWRTPLESLDWKVPKPQAEVEADGSFQPNSYGLKDGAVTGDYALTVLWTGESGLPGPDLFKGRYSDPKNPVLKVTIKEGNNELPTIALSGPPVDSKVIVQDGS